MIPCKEIVRKLSSDESLTLGTRMELKLHLMMCKHCSRYAKHLKVLRRALRRLFSETTHVDPAEVKKLEEDVLKRALR